MSQTIPFFFSIIWNNPTNQGTASLLNLTYEILFPFFPIACIVFLFPGRSKSRFDPDRPVAQLRQWTTGKHRRRYPSGSSGNERQLHRRAVRPGNRKRPVDFHSGQNAKHRFLFRYNRQIPTENQPTGTFRPGIYHGRRFYRTGQYAYCFRQQQIAITILRLSGKLCKNNTRLPGRSNRG